MTWIHELLPAWNQDLKVQATTSSHSHLVCQCVCFIWYKVNLGLFIYCIVSLLLFSFFFLFFFLFFFFVLSPKCKHAIVTILIIIFFISFLDVNLQCSLIPNWRNNIYIWESVNLCFLCKFNLGKLLIVINLFHFVSGIEIIDAQPIKKQPNSSLLKQSHKGKRHSSRFYLTPPCVSVWANDTIICCSLVYLVPSSKRWFASQYYCVVWSCVPLRKNQL